MFSLSARVVWPLTRRNRLARHDIDTQPALVEMLDVDGATGQGGYKLDLATVQKVVLLAGKTGVRLLLNLENDIASLDARGLIALATELHLGAAPDTTVDVDVQNFAVDNGLLTVATLAAVLLLDDFAFAIAVGAYSLEALDHGTHLSHHRLHAVAFATGAALDSALLSAATLALGANNRPLQGELRDLALVDILKRDFVCVVDGAGLGRTAVLHSTEHATKATAEGAATKELSEQVLGGHATSAGTTF